MENLTHTFIRANQDIRVLCISHSLMIGGAEKSLFFLAKGLKERGMDVCILAPATGPISDWYQKEGIPVSIGDVIQPFPLAVEPKNFDVCIANTLVSVEWIRKIPKEIPIVWSIRECTWNEYQQVYSITREDLARPEVLVFPSNAAQSVYAEAAKGLKLHTIYNGIDIDQIDTFIQSHQKDVLRAAYGCEPEQQLILTTGNLHPVKGQMDIVEIAHVMVWKSM